MERIIRRPELLNITGMSPATIARWIAAGLFPRPIKLGPNSVGWRESAVLAWIESREPAGEVAKEPSAQNEHRHPRRPRTGP